VATAPLLLFLVYGIKFKVYEAPVLGAAWTMATAIFLFATSTPIIADFAPLLLVLMVGVVGSLTAMLGGFLAATSAFALLPTASTLAQLASMPPPTNGRASHARYTTSSPTRSASLGYTSPGPAAGGKRTATSMTRSRRSSRPNTSAGRRWPTSAARSGCSTALRCGSLPNPPPATSRIWSTISSAPA
jgi:hypothetical protein